MIKKNEATMCKNKSVLKFKGKLYWKTFKSEFVRRFILKV